MATVLRELTAFGHTRQAQSRYHAAMRILVDLRTRYPKLFRAVVSSLAIGTLGGVASYAESARATDSCCYPGSPCCFAGSPCCAGHGRAE